MKTIDRICVAVGAGVAVGAVTFGALVHLINLRPDLLWEDEWYRGVTLLVAGGAALACWGVTGRSGQRSPS